MPYNLAATIHEYDICVCNVFKTDEILTVTPVLAGSLPTSRL